MELDYGSKPAIVIDNGSGYIKVGFSRQQQKPFILPSIVGRPKYNVVIPNNDNQYDTYIGSRLQENKRGLYKIKYPISHGIINNWDDMEILWKYAYTDLLKISPNESPVLLTQPNMNPPKHRRKLLQIFFQKFQVPAVFVGVQGVLSLFAAGKSTGIVLDSGDGVTHVVPIYEGCQLMNSSERIDLGGRNVTDHLRNLLRKSGVNLNTSAQFQLVKNIKEKHCAISLSPVEKIRQKKQKYILPDGQVVEFSNNEKDAGEILFSPDKIGLEYPSIVQILSNSLSKVDADIRQLLYNQILLSGGNTMFEGFYDRYNKQLKRILSTEVKFKITAPQNRQTLCWEGGSILASLPTFKNMWITKQQYHQQREHIIAKKSI